MKQVVENLRSGELSVIESPAPRCGPGEVCVRTRASLISPGTEKLLIEMGKKNLLSKAIARPDLVRLAIGKAKREGYVRVFREAMSRLDTPMALGYSAAGIVMNVGTSVRGISVGDAVACTGAAYANHAEFISVPGSACYSIPKPTRKQKQVSFEEASFVSLGGVALQGIRSGHIRPGEMVVVVGLGLIGLLTIQILRAYGCVVVATDLEATKIELARSLGCDMAVPLNALALESLVLNSTHGRGADAVLVTAAAKDNSPLLLAEQLAKKRGRIVLVGVSDIHLTRKMFWDKELVFTVSKASGPDAVVDGDSHPAGSWTEKQNHEEFLRLLADEKVRVGPLVSHRFPIEAATKAYDLILRGREPYVGVVLTYGTDVPHSTTLNAKSPSHAESQPEDYRTVGYIGAGLFSRNFLLPALTSIPGVRLNTLAAATGTSAHHAAGRFGFAAATTDYSTVFSDEAIQSIFIATRHSSHASIASEALKTGKRVFVEKPLAIDEKGLQSIARALRHSKNPVLMVGFNRRYSSLGRTMRQFFIDRSSPLHMLYRVNAGFIPPDHWTQDDAVGGGRIIGEVCHFVDFFQFLTGSLTTEVQAKSISGRQGRYMAGDNVSLTLRSADGSLGTVVYTAMGPKVYSRERVEVFCEDGVAVLEDFRELVTMRGTRKERKKLSGQDMGYRSEIASFFALDRSAAAGLIAEAFATTRTTFAAVQALTTGKTVRVDHRLKVR